MQSEVGFEPVNWRSIIISSLKKAGIKLLPALVGFGLARTGILGQSGMMKDIFPFGAALAAAAPSGSVAAAMVGIVLGFLVPGSGAETIRCAASALAVAGIKWALAELKPVRNSPVFSPAAALVGVVLTGMVVTSSVGAAISYDLAHYLAEGAMAAAGAYFFSGAVSAWQQRNSRSLSVQELYCLAVSVCIVSIPLCRISLFGLSPFSAVLMVLVLAAALRFGASGGAAAGIALGAVLALADGRFTALGIMALAGLAAALFAQLGVIASSAAFCISCSLAAISSGVVDVYLLIEAAAASIIFPIVGKDRVSFIFDILEPLSTFRTALRSDGYISGRLSAAAKGLEDASLTVSRVSEKLDKLDAPKANVVCRQATEVICADCAISGFCWDTARTDTQQLFDSLSDIIRRDGRLTRQNTPEQLRGRCARWGEMSDRINALYAEFAANEGARRRVTQVRRAVAGQLCGCGRLLNELAEESRQEESRGEQLSRQAADILSESGIFAEDVCCVRRRDGSLSVTMTLRESEEYPEPEFDAADILAEALDTSFDRPATVRQGESLLVTLESRPEFRLSVGIAQHSKGGGRLCGDTCDVLDGQGGTYILLSDGMGTGGRAAVDSALACDIMHRLLDAGFGEEGAMELVNSAMQISSDDEALVTLDCARVDVYTGELRLSKAGAASSYIVSGGKVTEVEADSLPLGIMGQVDSRVSEFALEPGDVVVMASDGVTAQGGRWLADRLEKAQTDDMQRLAKDISALAAAQCGQEDDDITVIAFRLDIFAPEDNDAIRAA